MYYESILSLFLTLTNELQTRSGNVQELRGKVQVNFLNEEKGICAGNFASYIIICASCASDRIPIAFNIVRYVNINIHNTCTSSSLIFKFLKNKKYTHRFLFSRGSC